MNTTQIDTVYAAVANKVDGTDTLSATEWNNISTAVNTAHNKINSLVTDVAAASENSGSDPHISFDSEDKHNLTISTTQADLKLNGKGGKINIEPISDLQIKPGDDITLCSHHREDPTEVSVKVHDGEDHPVKLQVNAANIVLTTKDKSQTKEKDQNGDDTETALYDDPNVLNVTVNSAKNTRGYLKVRAQAIDLRCEDHGGIALQPKGEDSDHHMNKIKFEHGGGDGLEFGTFNSEKTSLFTDEYRFNKDGIVYGVTRKKEVSDKYDGSDETTHYKYHKYSDDFYDKITFKTHRTSIENIIDAGIFQENVSKYGALSIEEQTFTSSSLNRHFNINVGQSGFYYKLNYTPGNLQNSPDISMHGLTQEDVDSISDLNNVICEENSLSSIGIAQAVITYIESAHLGTNDPQISHDQSSRYFAVYGPQEEIVGQLTVTRMAPQTIIKSNTGGTLSVDSAQCNLADIVTLVNYFKTGAGQTDGPWANT